MVNGGRCSITNHQSPITSDTVGRVKRDENKIRSREQMPIAKRIAVWVSERHRSRSGSLSMHGDLLFATILLISGVVPFVLISVASGFPATCQLHHEAFHAVMETLGCMMALGIAGFLLMRQAEKGNEYKLWPACAMLSMAILDAFHASVTPGREFVCLHSVAQFVGGVLIAMIWLPERFAKTALARELPKALAAACGLFGILSLLFPDSLPAMLNHGQFTFIPQLLNLAGGVLFLAGLAYFARRFSMGSPVSRPSWPRRIEAVPASNRGLEARGTCRDRDNMHLLFTAYCLLFAVAGLTFRLSGLWGVGWWLSHVVRLAGYVVAFAYVSINTSAEYLRLTETIAERERAEKKLEELNSHLESAVDDLERANKELQNFAHIAAHDLKTPLRAIGTLAAWLSTDYADKFDEQGKEQVALLVTKAKQMTALVDEVLRYSRLGRENSKAEQVDLNAVVSAVIKEVAPPENIEVSVEDGLPTLLCGRTHLVQIFQNLIGNAVKYMDKPKGWIRVGCTEQDGFWTFSVSDDGPGIERRYFEKIFQMFQTLGPRDGPESTGIGLAIVKKLVELNGGRVWVESQPGEGTTFFFILPKRMGVERAARDCDLQTSEAALRQESIGLLS
jgi:signal transduction histidine kinase